MADGSGGAGVAPLRLGVSLGSPEEAENGAKLMRGMEDFMARMMNLLRLMIVASPILIQSLYIHSVDLGTWLLRLLAMYAMLGAVCLPVLNQVFAFMQMERFQLAMERLCPDTARPECGREPAPALLKSLGSNVLGGKQVRLRWHRKRTYLYVTPDGWATSSDEGTATTFAMRYPAEEEEKRAHDTYVFQVSDPTSVKDRAWLTFSAVNQLRLGGWLRTVEDAEQACPYKILQDSSCPAGVCKLVCAWPDLPWPGQQLCTGFYLQEQLSGSRRFAGHGLDSNAALLEIVPV